MNDLPCKPTQKAQTTMALPPPPCQLLTPFYFFSFQSCLLSANDIHIS